MNFAFLISQCDSDSSDIVKLESWVILMEVWSYPAHPDAAGLLTREDPNWVVVLHKEKSRVRSFSETASNVRKLRSLHILLNNIVGH